MADSAATILKQLQPEHSVEWVYVTVLRSCKLQERCCTVKGGGQYPTRGGNYCGLCKKAVRRSVETPPPFPPAPSHLPGLLLVARGRCNTNGPPEILLCSSERRASKPLINFMRLDLSISGVLGGLGLEPATQHTLRFLAEYSLR